MTPVLKPRDKVSQTAAAELIQHAAQGLIDANAARTKALAAVAKRPVRVQDALAAYQQYERAEQAVTGAEATYMAVLTLWGVSRHGLAAAVGCRPATITRRIGQHPLATARGCDLYQLPGGGWGVRDREPKPLDFESVPTRARNASGTEPVDHGPAPATTEPVDPDPDPAAVEAAVQAAITEGGA